MRVLRPGCLIAAAWIALCVLQRPVGAASWKDFAGRPDQWYRSEEGLRIADNVLSFQSPGGSWPKNTDTASAPYRGDPQQLRGTFDNGATRGEMRFLARAYNATKQPGFRDALLKALDHVVEAQYPNGGWPQSYPPGSGYNRHVTFNDGAMVGLMELLREVAESKEYTFVGQPRRSRARRAFALGVEHPDETIPDHHRHRHLRTDPCNSFEVPLVSIHVRHVQRLSIGRYPASDPFLSNVKTDHSAILRLVAVSSPDVQLLR